MTQRNQYTQLQIDLGLVLWHLGACESVRLEVLKDPKAYYDLARKEPSFYLFYAHVDKFAWLLVANGYINPPVLPKESRLLFHQFDWHGNRHGRLRYQNNDHTDVCNLFPFAVLADGVRQWAGVLRGELVKIRGKR